MGLCKLNELGSFKNGLNFAKQTVTCGYKMIGVADFGDRMFPDYSNLEEINKELVNQDYLLQDGDILFVRSNGNKALVGRSMLINNLNENVTFSGFCIRFRPNTEKVIPLYLVYLLKSAQYRRQFSNTQQTNINNLNQQVLGNIIIDLPNMHEQSRVVNCLNSIDNKIHLNNRIIAELEQMTKTIYDYWFLQFDFPNTKGNPYRLSGGEMVWDEKLKSEIPKGWETCSVVELLDRTPNTTRVQASEYTIEGSIPIIDQSTDFIAGCTEDTSSIISIDNGAIIFGDHTRIVKYIDFEFARGADGTQILISNNQKKMPQLLFYYTIKKIDLSNYGYARHFKFLKDSLVVVPNEEVAKQFNGIAEPMHKMITKKIFENQELTKLRDWLLPMLMNGQVTFKTEDDSKEKYFDVKRVAETSSEYGER